MQTLVRVKTEECVLEQDNAAALKFLGACTGEVGTCGRGIEWSLTLVQIQQSYAEWYATELHNSLDPDVQVPDEVLAGRYIQQASPLVRSHVCGVSHRLTVEGLDRFAPRTTSGVVQRRQVLS